MTILENILIIAGISLDVFISMEIQGAMLQNIKKKTLFIVSSIVVGLQLLFFFGGYLAGYWVNYTGVYQDAAWVGYVIDFIILLLLGIRLLWKAIRREFINEKRTEITIGQYARIIASTTMYTLFAGLACGLVVEDVIPMLILIIVFSIIVVIAGTYTGYHFGFASKTVLYVINACVLWAAAIEILIMNVVQA